MLRHATWQALLTLLYGEVAAERIGDNHEDLVPSNTAIQLMDLGRDQLNNAEGRRIGLLIGNMPEYGKMSWEQVADEVLKRVLAAAGDGTLVVCLSDKRVPGAALKELRRPEERERERLEAERTGIAVTFW